MNLLEPDFMLRMVKELEANSGKGDWRDWHPDRSLIVSEIRHHVDKLAEAIDKHHPALVSEFAADLANYAMKASEIYGEPLPSDTVIEPGRPGVYRARPFRGNAERKYWEVHFVRSTADALALLKDVPLPPDSAGRLLGGVCVPMNWEEFPKHEDPDCLGLLVFVGREAEIVVHECAHAADFTMMRIECTEENVDWWHESLAQATSNLFGRVMEVRASHL